MNKNIEDLNLSFKEIKEKLSGARRASSLSPEEMEFANGVVDVVIRAIEGINKYSKPEKHISLTGEKLIMRMSYVLLLIAYSGTNGGDELYDKLQKLVLEHYNLNTGKVTENIASIGLRTGRIEEITEVMGQLSNFM